MKLAFKIVGGLVLVLVLIIAGFYLYLEATWKKNFSEFPHPAITASKDSSVIARGEYLANAVAHCAVCHQGGTNMENRAGTELKLNYSGGHVWDIPMFGKFVSANLTPDAETGIGNLSDGLVARVIRNGLDRNGDIAAFMSFAVGPMADEDLTAVISYLRNLPPVANPRPAEKYGLFGKLVGKALNPAIRPPIPKWVPESDSAKPERGEYLANGPAACFTCHTEADPMKGFVLVGPRFQGNGHPDPDPVDPSFELAAPNLTPDPTTGHITSWSEDDFLKRFRTGVVYSGSPMPWESYARMTEQDIRSLYRYLRSLEPVRHDIGPPRRPKGSWKPAKA